MKQRVVIAMALACSPKFLIAGSTHNGFGCDNPGAGAGHDE